MTSEPPPILCSGPIRLRGFEPADVPTVVDAGADPVTPLVSSVPACCSAPEAAAYIERQRRCRQDGFGYSFAIADARSDRAVGGLGVWLRDVDQGRASVGYWVLGPQRRKGVAGHALSAACRWALGPLGIARVELYAEPWNVASIRTAEHVGFVREGLARSWKEVDGERRDMYVYSLLGVDLP
ncbi:MAG: GNAT family N-acetyltransferase [Acidimicrobiales bacterium]